MILEDNLRYIFLKPDQRKILFNNLKYLELNFRDSKIKKIRFKPQKQNK